MNEANFDLVCFAHLRWDFVFQRPQHLMTRFAAERRVFYIEEPVIDGDEPRMEITHHTSGVYVAVPHLPKRLSKPEGRRQHMRLIDDLFEKYEILTFVAWYYTPMALAYTMHLTPRAIVYDCMDELSAFVSAPPSLKTRERQLMALADVVFTGGRSLYNHRKDRHPNLHLFPSSIDAAHFHIARSPLPDPEDQAAIPHPRLGFFGVIDERMDLALLKQLAEARPDWHFVMVGPVIKLNPQRLPKLPNLHYLGQKEYQDLPRYLAGWDVALMPFAINEATRFISPTKTLEYLAGGKPVISTPIEDVVHPYGKEDLVWIARDAHEFTHQAELALSLNGNHKAWLQRVDAYLAGHSWDQTFLDMKAAILDALARNQNSEDALASVPAGRVLPATGRSEAFVAPGLPASLAFPALLRSGEGARMAYDYLIVGAGFAGSVLAERLARGLNQRVLLIDCRSHIGGNAYDEYNDHGLLIHRYGPHIFHTNSRPVFEYLSQFTRWRPYEHRVRASVDGQLLPMPINLDTINQLYGANMSAFELEKFFESLAEPRPAIRTSEDVVVSKVGRLLYEKFFRNYTRKQWGVDPSELDASVTSRVPIRMNRDDRYFTDLFQAMPLHGYTRMFENMLDHPNIHIMLNTPMQEVVGLAPFHEMIYSGPVDEFFGYRFGKLPYRSLRFEFETLETEQHQPVAVINYPNEHMYTRVTEFKHLTGQRHPKTTLVYEYPQDDGDPYYPVPNPANAGLYQQYKALADATPGVHFVGRLATYRYYNMDQVTAQALALYDKLAGQNRHHRGESEPSYSIPSMRRLEEPFSKARLSGAAGRSRVSPEEA